MPANEYQQAVIEGSTGKGNMAVLAGAGVGKTWTLAEVGRYIASFAKKNRTKDNMRYLAFNRAIVDEASSKMPPNVKASTFHGFFYGLVGRNYASRVNQKFRLSNEDCAALLGIKEPLELNSKNLSPVQQWRMVRQGLDRFAKDDSRTIDGYHIPWQQGLTGDDMVILRSSLHNALTVAWQDIMQYQGQLPFNPMFYIKMGTVLNPARAAGIIVIDEAQDTFKNVEYWASGLFNKVIMVGDPAQGINKWTGADNALATLPLNRFSKPGTARRFLMPQSYRFGPEIAEVANLILPWTDEDTTIIGNPDITSEVGEYAEDPGMIICRTNSDVITSALASTRPVALTKNQQEEIRMLATAFGQLEQGIPCDYPEFAAFSDIHQLREYAEHDNPDLLTTVKLVEKHGHATLLKLAETALPPGTDGACLVSTIYRLKGLEAERVQLSSTGWEDPREENKTLTPDLAMALYTSVTRAKTHVGLGSALWVRDLESDSEDGEEE